MIRDAFALARRTITRHLPDRATIERGGQTTDGYGGVRDTPAVVAEDVPCRVAPQVASVVQQGEAAVSLGGWDVRLPYDTDLLPGDSVYVEGGRYLVLSTDRGRSDALTLLANCQRLET